MMEEPGSRNISYFSNHTLASCQSSFHLMIGFCCIQRESDLFPTTPAYVVVSITAAPDAM